MICNFLVMLSYIFFSWIFLVRLFFSEEKMVMGCVMFGLAGSVFRGEFNEGSALGRSLY